MADTRVVLPACPCPMRARLRRLAPSYTFTRCLLPQAYGKGNKARNEDEYRVQASPTTPAKLLMLTQGMGGSKKGWALPCRLLCIYELRQRDDLDFLGQRICLVAGI